MDPPAVVRVSAAFRADRRSAECPASLVRCLISHKVVLRDAMARLAALQSLRAAADRDRGCLKALRSVESPLDLQQRIYRQAVSLI